MSNVDSRVNGKTMTRTLKPNADDSLSWVWGWPADFLRQFGAKSESGSPEQLVDKLKKEEYEPKLLNEEPNDEKSNEQNCQKKKICSR